MALLAVATAATVAALAAAGHDRARQLAGGLLVGVGPAVAGPGGADALRPVARRAGRARALGAAAGRHRLVPRCSGSAWRPSCGRRSCCPGRSRGRARRATCPGAPSRAPPAAALPFALALALSPAASGTRSTCRRGAASRSRARRLALLLGLAEIGVGGPYAAMTVRTGQDLGEGWSDAAQTLSTLLAAAAVLTCAAARLARRTQAGPRRGALGGRALVAWPRSWPPSRWARCCRPSSCSGCCRCRCSCAGCAAGRRSLLCSRWCSRRRSSRPLLALRGLPARRDRARAARDLLLVALLVLLAVPSAQRAPQEAQRVAVR